MASFFNKLPGHAVTPPGEERRILRLLPVVTLGGSGGIALASLFAHSAAELFDETQLLSLDISLISIVFLFWTLILLVGIAAFIVMVMKGPAYVADAYPLDEAEKPDKGRR